MKKIVILLLSILLVSCSNKKALVLFDSYYSSFYKVEQSPYLDYMSVDIDKLEVENLIEYSDIVLSPLLYRMNISKLDSYSGNIYVLEEEGEADEKRTFITVSSVKVFNEIKEYMKKEGISNIALVSDTFSVNSKKEFNMFINDLSDYDLASLSIGESTDMIEIENFVKKNLKKDLWVINSDAYSLYIYEMLEESYRIIISENSFFNENNGNIIYTIDKNLEENIKNVLKNNESEIYSVMKKH